MKKKLLSLAVLVIAMTATAPPAPPVITLKGVEAATKISDKVKTAIAPKIAKLDAGLQKVASAHSTHHSASPEARAALHAEMQKIHDECMKLLEEITAQMTPEQKEAFIAYLHEQLKVSGIDPAHFPHGPRTHGKHHGQ